MECGGDLIMVCSLFGHRDCADSIRDILQVLIEKMITGNKVDCFYVGNQGKFDAIAMDVLIKLKEKYPHIRCYVVLAYLKTHADDFYLKHSLDGIYPAEVLMAPHDMAIPARNKWMGRQADYVLCYITRDKGGAARSVEYARNLNKRIINIADYLKR